MPIGFKNGTGGTQHSVQIAVNGMLAAGQPHGLLSVDADGRLAEIHTKGNPGAHLILRGGEHGSNYDPESIRTACDMLRKAGFPERVIVDCSHGNSGKDHRRESGVFRDVLYRKRPGGKCVAGLMLEGNLNEGCQKLNGGGLESLLYGTSITDACIGWAETEKLILETHAFLSESLQ